MKLLSGMLLKVTDETNIVWYGFLDYFDKDKNTNKQRIKLHACLSNDFTPWIKDITGNIPITSKIITGVSKIENSPEIQEAYNKLLIEASEWKGQTLF